MAIDSRLVAQNAWWGTAGGAAFETDAQLRAAARAPVHWAPPVDRIDLSQDGVYTLRGQRQVGKTTYLKALAQYVVRDCHWAPRRVMYADADALGATAHAPLARVIRGYLDAERARAGVPEPGTPAFAERRLVLLDEVTGIKNWQSAIRVLADEGSLGGVTVVATGSHARDLKVGGDRLPRRRGRIAERDLVLHPLSFRDYLGVVDPSLAVRLPTLTAAEAIVPSAAYAAAEQLHLAGDAVHARFDRYLATGGFLVAIAEEITNDGVIPESVYTDYRAAILGEVARLGRRDTVLRPIVQWLRGRLGQEFDWRELAREVHVAAHESVRDLVEDLELAFIWHIVHRVKTLAPCQPALKSPKRLYPVDPFTWHMLSAWARGGVSAGVTGWGATTETLADPALMGRLAESVVADHMRRIVGRMTYYYRSDSDQEIDFVSCPDGSVRAKVEVKYRRTITGRDQGVLRHRGGGLLLSQHTLHWTPPADDAEHPKGAVAEIPVSYALALWPAGSLIAVHD